MKHIRSAIGTMPRLVLASVWVVVKRPIEIASDYKVEESIVINIHEGRTGRPSRRADTSLLGYVGEMTIAIVVEQLIVWEARDEEIFPSIVVVVTHRHSHAVAGAGESGGFRDVLERPIALLMIEPVPKLRTSLGGKSAFCHGIGDLGAIDKENVETAVAVAIKECNPGPHGLDQVLLRGC